MKALAMDLSYAPKLASGLLESAGGGLQHLQLLLARTWAVGGLFEGFWQAVKACMELAALQLVIQLAFGHAIDQQVTAHQGLMCLDILTL